MKKVLGYIGGRKGETGEKGEKGDAGETCKNINYKGAWVAGTSYSQEVNIDVVEYNTVAYYCKEDTSGIVPPNADIEHWGEYNTEMIAKELRFSIALSDWTQDGEVYFVTKTFQNGTIPPSPNYYIECDEEARNQYAILSEITGQTVTISASAPCVVDITVVINDIREDINLEAGAFDAEIDIEINQDTGSNVSYRYEGISRIVWWGDGALNDENIHTYSDGEYRIKIDGEIKSDSAESFFVNGRSAVKSVRFNSPVLGIKAFHRCVNLESAEISEEQTSIPTLAFSRSGLRSVTIPDAVDLIDLSAFESCERLETVALGRGVKDIGLTAFQGCENLRSINLVGVQSIGDRAFRNCTALRGVQFDNLRSLDVAAFEGCESLDSIVIPSTITEIPQECFALCSGLIRVDLPTSVTNIRYRAFYSTGECEIYYAGTREQWRAIDKSSEWGGNTVHCIDD